MSQDETDELLRFVEYCRKKIEEFEKTEVRCALTGKSGSGKSSLINAIAGDRIAKVNVVETTQEPQNFKHRGILFTDLPGCGTLNWPRETYIQNLDLLSYDCFLLITADRFTEDDAFLFRELSAMGKTCFVIRNKFDIAVENGQYDNGYSEDQVREIITSDTRDNLNSLGVNPVEKLKIYLISARHPTKYDFRELLDDISSALSGVKKQRFVADMQAYSNEKLQQKREIAEQIVLWWSGLSMVNGANPIPGLDIAADIGIFTDLTRRIVSIYNLTSEGVEYIKTLLKKEKAPPVLLTKIAQFSATYLGVKIVSNVAGVAGKQAAKQAATQVSKQTVTGAAKQTAARVSKGLGSKLGKQVATKVASQSAAKAASRTTVKWIPFVGPVIAGAIGGMSTFIFGKQIINDSEQLAKEILEELIQNDSEQLAKEILEGN